MDGDGIRERIPWSEANSDAGVLVMDRNANGLIDDGTELFSNHSPQVPIGSGRNGFNAMIFLDALGNGGNGDGVLSAEDSGFDLLQIWIDRNHDGVSQLDELYRLSNLGIEAIDLGYWDSKRRDPNGNLFRYTAKVHMGDQHRGPRTKFAVDVFFPRP